MKFGLRSGYLFYGLGATVLVVTVVAESRHGRRADPSQHTDTLVVATTYEPTTLHPVFGSGRMSTVEILGALFEPLTLYDDQHRLVPRLAKEIPTLENGGLRVLPEAEARERGGAMETVWRLRPDARWSDGTPVRAEDFIFTFRLIMDEQVPAVSREVEERIAGMEARDDGRTLVVLWNDLYAFAHEGHRHLVVPRHLEEPRFQSLRGDDRQQYEHTAFNRQPVGNGPYRLVDWRPGCYLLLERNEHWHGPPARLTRIIYRFIPESETVLANLDTRRVGAVSPVALDHDLGLEFEQRAQARGDAAYVVHTQSGLLWDHIAFNTENPVTDRPVRQALALGLDREGLQAMIFEGRGAETDTWLPAVHPGAFPPPGRITPDLARYPYDPQRAAELLDAAGWRHLSTPMGGQGWRFKDGKPLRLTLAFEAGEPLANRVAQLIQHDWRALGVELLLRPVEARQFGESSAENRAYQGLSLYLWIMDPSADGITFWTSANIPTDENPARQNLYRWRNPRSDELLQRATRTLDRAERVKLLHQQQRVWADELPAIPLFFRPEISIRHRLLQGWRPTGTDTPITWNCHEWQWREEKEK